MLSYFRRLYDNEEEASKKRIPSGYYAELNEIKESFAEALQKVDQKDDMDNFLQPKTQVRFKHLLPYTTENTVQLVQQGSPNIFVQGLHVQLQNSSRAGHLTVVVSGHVTFY